MLEKLSKKQKEDEQRVESLDAILRIVCKVFKSNTSQSQLNQTGNNNNTSEALKNDNENNKTTTAATTSFKSKFKTHI